VFRFATWVLGGLAGATIAIKVYAHVGLLILAIAGWLVQRRALQSRAERVS